MNECISKSDVIELRGFDNPAKANNNNKENKEQTNGGGGVGKPVNLGNLLPGLNSHNQAGLNNQYEGKSKPHPGLPTGGISVEDLEREQQREVKVNKGERKESMKNMKEENNSTNASESEQGGEEGEHEEYEGGK